MKILLIEDEEALSDLLGYILAEDGNEVTVARDYEEGLNQLETEEFDLIMADMTIPGGNGIDLIDYARGNQGDSKYIVMSGYELTEEQRKLIDEWSCLFLSKPFRIDEVSEMIQSINE